MTLFFKPLNLTLSPNFFFNFENVLEDFSCTAELKRYKLFDYNFNVMLFGGDKKELHAQRNVFFFLENKKNSLFLLFPYCKNGL